MPMAKVKLWPYLGSNVKKLMLRPLFINMLVVILFCVVEKRRELLEHRHQFEKVKYPGSDGRPFMWFPE